MMTHSERSKKASRPCTASAMTFGNRCLNCGFGGPVQTYGDKLHENIVQCASPSYIGSLDEELDNQEFNEASDES